MDFSVLGTPEDPTFGLDTFGDVALGPDGEPLPQAEAIRQVVAEAELADAVGLDFFGVGEHHRADFAVSSPEMVLASIAARTERIRLGSAVTVLSSDDPVRVFERFATLDALSGGRAEVGVVLNLFGVHPADDASPAVKQDVEHIDVMQNRVWLDALLATQGVVSLTPPQINKKGDVVLLSAVPSTSPASDDTANQYVVPLVRPVTMKVDPVTGVVVASVHGAPLTVLR